MNIIFFSCTFCKRIFSYISGWPLQVIMPSAFNRFFWVYILKASTKTAYVIQDLRNRFKCCQNPVSCKIYFLTNNYYSKDHNCMEILVKLIFFALKLPLHYFYYYYLLIRVFHISVSWGSSTGVWVTASLLKSPGLFSIFWPFSIMH